MTFLELAENILKDNKKPMTIDEMWNYAVSSGLDIKLGSTGATPWATLSALLGDQIRNKGKKSPFGRTDTRPTSYYLLSQKHTLNFEMVDVNEIKQSVNNKKTSEGLAEKHLHSFLAYYAKLYLKVYTKTIDHTKSKKGGYGEWMHPDMVGCNFAFEELKKEVADLNEILGKEAIRLFSFELKLEVNSSNLREVFFQTVSNSSWAHESYLVASKYSRDDDFVQELKRLSSSFGIGIIELNTNDPDQSKVVYPARTKEYLDWETINKLADKNPDFSGFLVRIKKDLHSSEVTVERYDKVTDKDNLIKSIH